MTLRPWTDTDLDRMLARAERLDAEAKPAHDAHRMARAAYRLGKPHPIRNRDTWASALGDLAGLAWMALAWLVATSLLMWLQS
jgi:hypothetical protein